MKSHSQWTIPHQSISPPSWSWPSLPFGHHICSVLLWLQPLLHSSVRNRNSILLFFSPPLLTFWWNGPAIDDRQQIPISWAAMQCAVSQRQVMPCLTATHQQGGDLNLSRLPPQHTHTSPSTYSCSIFNLGWLRNRPNIKHLRIQSVCFCLYLLLPNYLVRVCLVHLNDAPDHFKKQSHITPANSDRSTLQ